MSSAKREVCLIVVEGLMCNRGDIGCSTFMFGVARPTFPLFFESSMKALFLLDVFPHFLVTIETELGLPGFVKPFVTLGTVFFPFGMSLDYLAGHEGGLDCISPGLRSEERQ
jgi:hypothetical protein